MALVRHAARLAIFGASLVASAGCGDRVEQYPDVEQERGETTVGGEQTPARRALPPDRVHGPQPDDDLSGEEIEPL